MVFAEILRLSEKKRVGISLIDVENYLKQHPGFQECPQSLAVVLAAGQISDVVELHDRLIAATARHLNLQLITNDPDIQRSAWVRTIW